MRDANTPDHAEPTAWEVKLQTLLAEVDGIATELEGQPAQLLTLLRQIEALHRRIQDGPFRTSLPADRHQFFTLLQAMETSGGWPYIPRLQLRTFLDLLDRGDIDLAATRLPEAPSQDVARDALSPDPDGDGGQ
jgi:hypothetical protein